MLSCNIYVTISIELFYCASRSCTFYFLLHKSLYHFHVFHIFYMDDSRNTTSHISLSICSNNHTYNASGVCYTLDSSLLCSVLLCFCFLTSWSYFRLLNLKTTWCVIFHIANIIKINLTSNNI